MKNSMEATCKKVLQDACGRQLLCFSEGRTATPFSGAGTAQQAQPCPRTLAEQVTKAHLDQTNVTCQDMVALFKWVGLSSAEREKWLVVHEALWTRHGLGTDFNARVRWKSTPMTSGRQHPKLVPVERVRHRTTDSQGASRGH